MERKVEGKTVDVYVRLGTSAWGQSGEDARTLSFARPPRRESAPVVRRLSNKGADRSRRLQRGALP